MQSIDDRKSHADIGRELTLYDTHELAGAGLPLWLPDGAAIVDALKEYILDAERRAGYRHVHTPPLGKRALYERSGHWEHFADDMFPPIRMHEKDDSGEESRDDLVLRPVLCPHHFLVFGSRLRSHRELPLRMGEFDRMFRRERSGAVGGLLRVRAITLNDGHVFCAPGQVVDEVALALRMIDEAYDVLGIEPAYAMLAVRGAGKSYAGTDEQWERAEDFLWQAAGHHGLELKRVEGEAAFYGPKIDIQVHDAAGKEFTLSTVQVDLVGPERFDLAYVGPSGAKERPVIVHRSVLSSMERMVAYLLEVAQGALPPWLAPRQVLILPVTEEQAAYAGELAGMAAAAGLRVEVDDRADTLAARIRQAQARKVPYLGIVGERERESGTVAARLRGDDTRQSMRQPMPAAAFVDRVRQVVAARSRDLAS